MTTIVDNLVYWIKNWLRQFIKKPEPWDLLNVDEEFTKVNFKKQGRDWIIYYDGKPVDRLTYSDLRGIEGKTYRSAKYDIVYHLETRFWKFKNRQLALKSAGLLLDLMGY